MLLEMSDARKYAVRYVDGSERLIDAEWPYLAEAEARKLDESGRRVTPRLVKVELVEL